MTYYSIVKQIQSLPPLSNAPLLIQQLYIDGSNNVDIIKLVRTIESDASLTANILRMINAPIYGFSKKIASISQAVTLFGTDKIYGLVVKYALEETVKANTGVYGLSSSEFNDICHLQSSLMMQWYSTVDLRHAQFLAPLALIMESGKLVLANEVMRSDYTKEYKKGFKKCSSIEEYEHTLVGTTSYYISGLLFEYWNLEPLYVEILKGLDYDASVSSKVANYISTLDVIRVAVNLKDVLTKDAIYRACGAVEDLGLEADEFEKIALRVKKQYDRVK